jgi:hypothetical protein
MASVRVRNFTPSVNGLPFPNYWPLHPADYTIVFEGITISIGDAFNGLCGGMVFTVADLFNAGLLPPPGAANPAGGSPAFNYIVARLTNSFADAAKYVSWIQLSDHDTWIARGLAWHEITEEWPLIKADLDQNRLCPLGLVRGQELPIIGTTPAVITDLGQCHQVLAWGYDLNATSLSVLIYDPDYLGDGNIITLDIGNPGHTTPLAVSNWNNGSPGYYRGFFRANYIFHDPRTPVTGAFFVPVVTSSGFPNGGSIPFPPNPVPAGPTQPDRLRPNQGLTTGQAITSADGRFRLILQLDGNLVLYRPGNIPLWASNTAGHPNIWDVVMQDDGNLVIYDIRSQPVWASNTNRHPGAWITVQNDGNLVIYDSANHPLFASNTAVPSQPVAPSQPDQLLPNQGLTVGQSLSSADDRFRLTLQGDGNLVLYRPGNVPLWASNTDGHSDVWDVVMQGDGNLVIYSVRGRPLWASNTSGRSGARMIVQNDGNVVVYDSANHPLWATNTVVPGQPMSPSQGDRLLPNQGLEVGASITSADGRFRFVLQSDGNLVLYGPGNVPLWASNTNGHFDVWDAVMQDDGNLVIYNIRGKPLWASNTNGRASAWLIAQDDGNVVIYDSNNKPLWATR